VRSNGGQLLSASALVALGTSVLLAALLGFGLSALASTPSGDAVEAARGEAAAVVIPAETVSRSAPSRARRHAARETTVAVPASSFARPAPASRPTVSGGSATAGATRSKSLTRPTPGPTSPAAPNASHPPKHGHGNGHGHGKPAKH
jgi:hypothetical protein